MAAEMGVNPGWALAHLGMARVVGQRNKDLSASAAMLPDVVFDDGIATLEPVFLPEPLEDPLGHMPLLAQRQMVLLQDPVDDPHERIELRAPRRTVPPIARRHRKPQHLGNRLAVKPELLAASRVISSWRSRSKRSPR